MKNMTCLVLSMLILLSCSYKVDKEKAEAARVDGASLSFAQIRSVLGPKCARCHGNEAWMNSYPAAKAMAQEISSRIQGIGPNRTMPPANAVQLTEEEKAAIVAWVRAGAPEAPGGQPSPPPGPPPEPPPPERLNFALVKRGVFDGKCLRCHRTQLDTFEHVRPLLKDIEVRVQDIGGELQMPPAARPQLTQQELKMLLDWIHAGAPEE